MAKGFKDFLKAQHSAVVNPDDKSLKAKLIRAFAQVEIGKPVRISFRSEADLKVVKDWIAHNQSLRYLETDHDWGGDQLFYHCEGDEELYVSLWIPKDRKKYDCNITFEYPEADL